MAEQIPNGMNGTMKPQNKVVEQVIRTPDRNPSPQPTLLGVPGASHSNQSLHKILSPEHGSGYVAPKFEGKKQQMEDGKQDLDSFAGLC